MSYLLLVCIPSFAQEKPSLQSLFNESNAALAKANASDDVIVIDLSEWLNEYDQTLQIATGKSYRFTNGELRWLGGDEPLFEISNGSNVEFAEGVTVFGNSISSSSFSVLNYATNGYRRAPLVVIKDAKITVNGASLIANSYNWSDYGMSDVFFFENTSNSADLSGELILASSDLDGSITSETQYGVIEIYTWRKNIVHGGIKSNAKINFAFAYAYINPIYHFSTSNDCQNKELEAIRPPIKAYLYNSTIDLASTGVINTNGYISQDVLSSLLSSSLPAIEVDANSYINNPRKIIEIYGDHYTPKQTDLEALKVKDLDTNKYELVLRDNAVYIQQKSLTGQQWLQEQINSYVNITTDTDVQPGIITIPEEGIELTDFLRVPNSAFVKLVGGPITISKNFNSSPDMAVKIENGAHLFIDNTWDFNSLPLKSYAWLFANHGHLTFGENSTLLNTWSETKRDGAFIYNTGKFDFNNPNSAAYKRDLKFNNVFVDGNGDVVIYNGDIWTPEESIIAKSCTMYGGSVQSSSKPTVTAETFYMYEGSIPSTVVMDVDYAELVDGGFHYGDSYVNTITTGGNITTAYTIIFKDNDKDHCLYLTSAFKYKTPIKANWSRMDFSKPYVIVRGKDYQLTKEDLEKCNFVDLPSDVRAKLEGNTIVLTKGNKSLIDLFNEADEGTEEDPTDIMGDQDDVDVEEPTDGKPDLHILFGDSKNKEDGEKPKKSLTFLFDGEYGIRIPATSSFEFKNININLGEHAINNVIEVYGKLIINVNVYFYNVCTCTNHVIYVRPGGTLIWRGGKNSIPGVVIYNDGGTVIYEGGDTYGTTYGVHNTNGGTVIIKGGSIGGGDYAIYNPSGGEIHLYDGCTVNGSIYSDGNITTGGNVGISNIYIPWTCHINLTSRITNNWFININNIQNITVPTPFIYGTNGYKLTEEDLECIMTNLPESYCLILDVNVNIIYIVDSCQDGIENTTMTDATFTGKIYSADGRMNEGGDGIKIVRYPDGTTRKIIRK